MDTVIVVQEGRCVFRGFDAAAGGHLGVQILNLMPWRKPTRIPAHYPQARRIKKACPLQGRLF
jgi:hypothetical protein